jgi:hypothetical protein
MRIKPNISTRMKIHHAFAGLFVLVAASSAATSPTFINPADIVERRDEFDGMQVPLGGILFGEGEGLCLLDQRASLDGGIPRARIAIAGRASRVLIEGLNRGDPDRPMRDPDPAHHAGRFVFVEGTFRARRRSTEPAPAPRCSEWEIEPTTIRFPAPRSM